MPDADIILHSDMRRWTAAQWQRFARDSSPSPKVVRGREWNAAAEVVRENLSARAEMLRHVPKRRATPETVRSWELIAAAVDDRTGWAVESLLLCEAPDAAALGLKIRLAAEFDCLGDPEIAAALVADSDRLLSPQRLDKCVE